ncbi:MAG: hypothetical protein JNL68_12135 [Burkholderiales bacterium]|nr:hypothetical protein [Burkholderiales bacterium]
MDHDQALTILKDLADGKDPETGDPFPPDSPYQRPDVIRALFHAAREMESTVASEARRGDPGKGSLPENAAGAPLASAAASPRRGAPAPRSGKPWSTEEDEKLVAGFDAGQTIPALATDHGRSRIAIEARLARFGKVPMPAGVRGGKTSHASDIDCALYATQA